MKENIIGIANAIHRERKFQQEKWGDNSHEVGAFLLIMQKELQEAVEAWVENSGDREALLEILQVISVGVACLEQHGIVERAIDQLRPIPDLFKEEVGPSCVYVYSFPSHATLNKDFETPVYCTQEHKYIYLGPNLWLKAPRYWD